MRKLERHFTFDGAGGFHEVYDFVTSTVKYSEQNGRFTYTCQPMRVVDPDSVGLEVSVWETETERPNDWLVRNKWIAEINISQEKRGEIVGTLYVETDPACWHRPEDAPWRHQQKREEPWPVPKATGTRFVLELWRKLTEDWLQRSEPTPAEVGAGDGASCLPGFPQTTKGREKWRKSYGVILEKREEYRGLYDDFKTDEPNPAVDDLRDTLAAMPEWKKKPSASTVRRIIKYGDEYLLR